MKKAAKLLTLLILIMMLTACARQADTTEDTGDQDEVNGAALHDYADQSDLADEYDENGGEASEAIQVKQPRTEAERDENLVKLGKVWGFVKYTHNAFITGAKCWDEELLRLIPIVYNAHPSEVNGILYDWFISLGDDGYDTIVPPPVGAELRKMADLSWINYEYLGVLAAPLLRFDGTPDHLGRFLAPVSFYFIGIPDFSNQNLHANMDFSDIGYRLLGLFRLWNAMKYYFPHLDVLDVDWNDLLIEFIPKMLESADRHSYELTIASMTHHLHDAHVRFIDTAFFTEKFGQYMAPVQLMAAEEQFAVYEIFGSDNPLARGDVILGVNGREIDEITDEKRMFLSYPNDEKVSEFLTVRWVEGAPALLRSHTQVMEIDILRGDAPMTLTVDGVIAEEWWLGLAPTDVKSHTLLSGNIGLIDPGLPSGEDVRHIMDELADTRGIIIDLRRPPSGMFPHEMREYLMERSPRLGYISLPSQTHPGVRSDRHFSWAGGQRSPYAFIYDRPVVLLISTWTASFPESIVMYLRSAPNVTVIGPWTMGSNGNFASLPLPGGMTMWYTSHGIYTPDGGQTFRIGLEPDIRVDRTIQGIAEGRDEIMEAAIEFILGG